MRLSRTQSTMNRSDFRWTICSPPAVWPLRGHTQPKLRANGSPEFPTYPFLGMLCSRYPAWVSSDLTYAVAYCSLPVIVRLSAPGFCANEAVELHLSITACLSLCLHLTRIVTATGSRLDSWWVVSPFQGESFTH